MMMMMMMIIIIIITKMIPVIIGATGTISKTFRKYVSNIPGNHEQDLTCTPVHIYNCKNL